MEKWKDWVGWEGLYQISNKGRVKSFWKDKNGQILKLIRRLDGYLVVCLHRGGKQKTVYVHRGVAETFLGAAPEGCEVNHKNGIKDDNRVENLEWITRSENHKHAYRVLGKKAPCSPQRGEANGSAKVTRRQVRQIRKLADVGHSQAELAEMFGVTQSAISKIVLCRTWKHVA